MVLEGKAQLPGFQATRLPIKEWFATPWSGTPELDAIKWSSLGDEPLAALHLLRWDKKNISMVEMTRQWYSSKNLHLPRGSTAWPEFCSGRRGSIIEGRKIYNPSL